MAIAHSKEVLMVRLANVGRKDEVVLVLLVHVVHAESLPGRIGEARDHVVLYDFQAFLRLVLLDSEWILFRVRYSVVVVDSLILERGRLRYTGYQALYRAGHRIVIHGQLILNQRTGVRSGGCSLILR